jgi:hypothetical protein
MYSGLGGISDTDTSVFSWGLRELSLFQPFLRAAQEGFPKSEPVSLFQGRSGIEWGRLGMRCFHRREFFIGEKAQEALRLCCRSLFFPL